MKATAHSRVLFLAQSGIIAALYVALTLLSSVFGLSGQNLIQFRLSEALTILPFFTPAAIPGLTVGCLVANILTGSVPWDIAFGTLATLLGAVGTYLLRKHRFLVSIPPILANTLIVPFVIYYCYGLDASFSAFPVAVGLLLTAGCVFIGEFICCGVLGTLLETVLIRNSRLFGNRPKTSSDQNPACKN